MTIKDLFNVFKPKVENNKHITVLVIEDNQVDQRIVCAAIERGGYSVLKASDGQGGLFQARANRPDLIILDYNLSDAKGPEICKNLKADDSTKQIPVLFLTSMNSPGSVMDCYEFGGENYLSKPISPQLLLKQIRSTLKDKQTEN